MSITASFYSGLSGLSAHATAMQVIGDNIANVHTTGFKGSTVHFADVLGVALTGVSGGNQTGAAGQSALEPLRAPPHSPRQLFDRALRLCRPA